MNVIFRLAAHTEPTTPTEPSITPSPPPLKPVTSEPSGLHRRAARDKNMFRALVDNSGSSAVRRFEGDPVWAKIRIDAEMEAANVRGEILGSFFSFFFHLFCHISIKTV